MNIVNNLQFSAELTAIQTLALTAHQALFFFWRPAGCPQISETSIVSTKHLSIDMHKIIEADHHSAAHSSRCVA